MKKVFSLTLALLLLLNISASFAQENNNAENDISENVELFLRNNDVPRFRKYRFLITSNYLSFS